MWTNMKTNYWVSTQEATLTAIPGQLKKLSQQVQQKQTEVWSKFQSKQKSEFEHCQHKRKELSRA